LNNSHVQKQKTPCPFIKPLKTANIDQKRSSFLLNEEK
jgi:hypothetical protein